MKKLRNSSENRIARSQWELTISRNKHIPQIYVWENLFTIALFLAEMIDIAEVIINFSKN